MKTLLIGNFGKPNIGDELILNAALDVYPEALVMTNNADFSLCFCERNFECVPFSPTGIRSFLRFLFHKDYRAQLLALKDKVDLVVFPGGGLFAIKFRAVLLWFFVFLWVRKIFESSIPVRFEMQGIDNGLGWCAKRLVQYVFSRVEKISVREEASAKVLNDLSISGVEVLEDRVADFLKKQGLEKRGEASRVILVNGLSGMDEVFDRGMVELSKNHEIIYLLFEEGDRASVPERFLRNCFLPKTKSELFDYFYKAEKVIGERFHFLLLGKFFCGSENTFLLKAPYSEKVKNFVAAHGIDVFKPV